MTKRRITEHPIIDIPKEELIKFSFNGKQLFAQKDEMISSALFANGIHIFGHHPKDGAPQGLFCANGQCSQCLVLVDGKPVKGCMVPVKDGMAVRSCEGLPELPDDDVPSTDHSPVQDIETNILIIGAGPSGLSAAQVLGEAGVKVILIDDKDRLGGKLVLQTHKFFGSQADCYAGTRGIDIAKILAKAVGKYDNVDVWLKSTALAVYNDKKIGILKDEEYILVKPAILLVATGAREKMLTFPGNTLPGVYGAGAFQTLVNRDLIRACERLFIVGGGNVGLIAGYHAIQAGIKVVGLVEALPKCGGYKVHEDKLRHLGVSIYTSHTILSANGDQKVESVTIAEINEKFQPVEGTEKTFAVDTCLIAVGLDPVNEFYLKAEKFGVKVYTAGDAEEIAEASAAMFSGKIQGIKIAKSLGLKIDEGNIDALEELAEVLRSPGGDIRVQPVSEKEEGVFPIFHCFQTIPCNPCTSVCPVNQIFTINDDILDLPYFKGEEDCLGCGKCVAVCPGLAVTLVDYRKDVEMPTVVIPFEVAVKKVDKGEIMTVISENGQIIGDFPVERVRILKDYPRTQLIYVKIPKKNAKRAAGFLVQKWVISKPLDIITTSPLPDDAIVCRCERITAGEIRSWIRKGVRDFNQLKAITRAGMGACGSKTCSTLIYRLFREEGVPLEDITTGVPRPLFIEVALGTFASEKKGKEE